MIEVPKGTRAGYAPRYKPKIEGWYLGTFYTGGEDSFSQPVALDRKGNFWLGSFDPTRRALHCGRGKPAETPGEHLLRLLK